MLFFAVGAPVLAYKFIYDWWDLTRDSDFGANYWYFVLFKWFTYLVNPFENFGLGLS